MKYEDDVVIYDVDWITIHAAQFPMYRAYYKDNYEMKTEFYFSKIEAEIALMHDNVVRVNE